MDDCRLVTGNQRKKPLQYRLCRECILVDHLIAPDLGKILGWRDFARAANQGSEKAIKLLDVHCSLAAKRWSTLARLSKSESFNGSGVRFWQMIPYSRSGRCGTLLALEAENVGNHVICISLGYNKVRHTLVA